MLEPIPPPLTIQVPLFAVLELDRGIVYEQGKRHKRQKRLCIPSFEQGRSMASFLVAVQVQLGSGLGLGLGLGVGLGLP